MCLSAPAAGASARDTGNRISLAGLHSFAVTRDFDFVLTLDRNRACNPSRSLRFQRRSSVSLKSAEATGCSLALRLRRLCTPDGQRDAAGSGRVRRRATLRASQAALENREPLNTSGWGWGFPAVFQRDDGGERFSRGAQVRSSTRHAAGDGCIARRIALAFADYLRSSAIVFSSGRSRSACAHAFSASANARAAVAALPS
jgi:hypothetical protein